ncbi:MAG: SPOR domain-containing protein [Rhodospirillaceae bacterium]
MTEPEILGPGEYYEETRPGMSPLAKAFAVGTIAVGAIALAGVVWFAYQQGIRSGAEDAAPVIRADEEPIKREPENPGGLDVPHQDKLVFGRLAPGQIEEPVERLLPPPEEPAERPQPAVEPPKPEISAEPAPESVPGPVAENVPAAQFESVEQMAAPEPAPPEPEVASTPPPPPPPAAPAPAEPAPVPQAAGTKPILAPAVKPKPATPVTGGGWRVQLAAVSSQDRARSEWSRIQSRNNDILGSLDLNVQSVKLDRGTFYRIQAGPLADRAAASSLCGQLKRRNQDCLVVAP